MELPEFLRAWLDEDERFAPGIHLEVCSAVARTVRNGVVWAVGDCDCGIPARLLADVAAKRRILDAITERLNEDEPDGGWEGANAETDGMVDQVLCALAAPFADRPDYREEWKP